MSTIAAEDFYRAISPLVLRRGLPSPGAPKGSPVPARIGAAIHGTKQEKSTFAGVDILAYSCTIVVGCSGRCELREGRFRRRSPPGRPRPWMCGPVRSAPTLGMRTVWTTSSIHGVEPPT